MTSETLGPVIGTVVAAGVILALFYRRARRFFGRQEIGTKRFTARIVLCAAATMLFVVFPGAPVWAKLTGVVLGLTLAGVGLSTSRIEPSETGWCYTPNSYLGLILVSALFGRILYRLWGMRNVSAALERTPPTWNQALHGNPAGRILILALVTYFGAYSAGLLYRVSRLRREAASGRG